jgi:hypothetical protein
LILLEINIKTLILRGFLNRYYARKQFLPEAGQDEKMPLRLEMKGFEDD